MNRVSVGLLLSPEFRWSRIYLQSSVIHLDTDLRSWDLFDDGQSVKTLKCNQINDRIGLSSTSMLIQVDSIFSLEHVDSARGGFIAHSQIELCSCTLKSCRHSSEGKLQREQI